MKKLLLVLTLLIVPALPGCDDSPSFDEIQATNDRVKADVKSQVGHEALIGYEQTGFDVSVTVTLIDADQAKAAQSKDRVETIVKRHWPKANEVVVKAQPQ